MNKQFEQYAAALEASGDYRVSRRFEPVDIYHDLSALPSAPRKMLVVDVETTGLDVSEDKTIEIGLVLVEFDPPSGRVGRVLERICAFEDPGMPISEVICGITGITDNDVRGEAFDDAAVNEVVAQADVVIAHNAQFDRGFLEARFPAFIEKWWACSFREGPWGQLNVGSRRQEHLASAVSGIFYDAHRALTDAEVLLRLLTEAVPGGTTVLGHILASSERETYRLWATGAPFEAKDELKKARGYSWCVEPGKHEFKAWHKDGLVKSELDTELGALRALYKNIASPSVVVDRMTGRERYSTRFASRDRRTL